jgi:hypothetical protein
MRVSLRRRARDLLVAKNATDESMLALAGAGFPACRA